MDSDCSTSHSSRCAQNSAPATPETPRFSCSASQRRARKKKERRQRPPKRQNTTTKNAVKLRLLKSASIAAPISGHEGYIFFKGVFINSRVNYSGVRRYQAWSFRLYSGRYLGIPRVYTRVSREHIPGYPESRYRTEHLNTQPSKTSVLAGRTPSAVENNAVLQPVGQSSVDSSLQWTQVRENSTASSHRHPQRLPFYMPHRYLHT